MDFTDLDPDACMHSVSLDVAEDMRQHYRDLYVHMLQARKRMDEGMPNVVLAGLTVLWLECVHSAFGTVEYESAISILRDVQPNGKSVYREMRRAARDFLRRSKWLPVKRST
jgi:hypothetical protein